MTDPDDDDQTGLPPELEQLLRGLGGGELDPQLVQMMQGMGLDKIDPQMLSMVMGQVQAMFAAPEGPTAVNAELATDTARKMVSAEGDTLATAADGRAAEVWPEDLRPLLRSRGFAGEVRDLMARCQERGLEPEDLDRLGEMSERPAWRAVAAFAREYQQVLGLQGALDYAGLHLPRAEHAAASTVWLEHRLLLADREDVLDVARAAARIQSHAAEIVAAVPVTAAGREVAS